MKENAKRKSKPKYNYNDEPIAISPWRWIPSKEDGNRWVSLEGHRKTDR